MLIRKKNIKHKLISKRKDIKNKLNVLKHGQIVHDNLFEPITKHLQNIEHKLGPSTNTKDTIKLPLKKEDKSFGIKTEYEMNYDKNESSNDDDYDVDDDDDDDDDDKKSVASEPINFQSTPIEFSDNTPKGIINFNPSVTATAPHIKRKLSFSTNKLQPSNILRKSIIENVEESLKEEEDQKQKEYENKLNKSIMERSLADYEEQYHPLPLKYIKRFISKESDGRLRVKLDKDIEQFSIGNKKINFDGPDLLVSGKKYKGTKGLYGLLFNQKVPTIYTKDDARNYVQILKKANALKKYFTPTSELISSNNIKFKKVVQPLLKKITDEDDNDNNLNLKQGEGLLMSLSNNPIDYVFWDDPNELVDRLQLLIASQTAGNTGHVNEINSIIEELREAKIIE